MSFPNIFPKATKIAAKKCGPYSTSSYFVNSSFPRVLNNIIFTLKINMYKKVLYNIKAMSMRIYLNLGFF